MSWFPEMLEADGVEQMQESTSEQQLYPITSGHSVWKNSPRGLSILS